MHAWPMCPFSFHGRSMQFSYFQLMSSAFRQLSYWLSDKSFQVNTPTYRKIKSNSQSAYRNQLHCLRLNESFEIITLSHEMLCHSIKNRAEKRKAWTFNMHFKNTKIPETPVPCGESPSPGNQATATEIFQHFLD